MAGLGYTVSAENRTLATADGTLDLWELTPATQKPIELVGLIIDVTSELQEAQEEWLRFEIITGHTTVGSGGAAATPRPTDHDEAASFTAVVDNTTIASAGTAITKAAFAVQVRAGRDLWFPDRFGLRCANNELLVVRLMAAVTDDLIVNTTAFVLEL